MIASLQDANVTLLAELITYPDYVAADRIEKLQLVFLGVLVQAILYWLTKEKLAGFDETEKRV